MTCPATSGYDDKITVTAKQTGTSNIVEKAVASATIVAKSAISTISKIAKPYTLEPNAILAQDCLALLAEDGQTLLLEIG